MTEEEWMVCTDPEGMVEFVLKSSKLLWRKERLFGVAVCQRISGLITDERSRKAVEVAARFADGEAKEEELRTAYKAAFDVADVLERSNDLSVDKLRHAAWAADFTAHPQWRLGGIASEAAEAAGTTNESAAQADLMRCIFGNPFCPVTLNPAWQSLTVKQLAVTIYDERAFDRLPILADALEDAGCGSEAILSHLRGPGPHTRGCWALDLLLEKE